ncbi:MAG: polymer-forming cytoskeletal protein [Bacteroidia bacterium]|nr:polymer-forming cytoskeletal protein [Bacteroidia bacterium]
MEKVLSSIKSLATKAPETVVNVNEVSRIALGASIKGDLSSRTDIRVDGNVDGVLYSEGRIVVGESALLSGSLLCRNLDLWGKMDGDLYIRDILSLKSSAVVNGNIFVRKMQIEMGAQLNGSCKMISEEEFDKLAAQVVKNPIPNKGARTEKK